jgi:hypothetical protein
LFTLFLTPIALLPNLNERRKARGIGAPLNRRAQVLSLGKPLRERPQFYVACALVLCILISALLGD